MKAVKVPYDQLTPEALEGVVEEFVTRDGTDYGETEASLDTKINQVMNQVRTGKAVVVFDPESETCNIFRADDPALKGIN
nr:YheU family protein [uncultured Desulfobacter sp.]